VFGPCERVGGAVADQQLVGGATERELIVAVEELRAETSEAEEDELLTLLDVVTGWCSPGQRLDR